MQSNKAPTAGVIFLHGSGDTGDGLRAWLNAASGRQFEANLVTHGIKVLFPTAPLRPDPPGGGKLSHVWHDRKEHSLDGPAEEEGVRESIALVEQLVAQFESEGIEKSKVIIGGFSQGGSLALQCLSRTWASNIWQDFSVCLTFWYIHRIHIIYSMPYHPYIYHTGCVIGCCLCSGDLCALKD